MGILFICMLLGQVVALPGCQYQAQKTCCIVFNTAELETTMKILFLPQPSSYEVRQRA